MYTPAKLETYFLQLVNETRAKAGVGSLTFDGELLESSDAHSLWMGKTDTFSHTGVGGSTPMQRMTAAGYGWQSAGENIAWYPGDFTESTVRALHDMLVNSPVHYANIINGSFEEIGIGLQIGPSGGGLGVYVTQNFGKPNAEEMGEGNDVGKGNGTIKGTKGKDMLFGTDEADAMYGGAGNDTYYVRQRGDKVFEKAGEGRDKVISVYTYSLAGQDVEDLMLFGDTNINGAGNSLNNVLTGNAGKNTLKGGAGSDTLNGKGGADILWGGAGKDTFFFDSVTAADGDTIRDFARRSDRIDLRKIDANEQADGNQKFKYIAAQDFHGVAGELRAYKSGGMTYITGDTNGDGTADFTITVSGTKTFASTDFFL